MSLEGGYPRESFCEPLGIRAGEGGMCECTHLFS